MSDNASQNHTLVEPRVVAATALLLGGGALGIGLMAAHVLIPVGMGLAMLACLATAWIYAGHFKAAYSAVSQKESYTGAPAKELLVVFIMTIIILVVSTVVFIDVFFEEPAEKLHSRLDFSRMTLETIPNSPNKHPMIHFVNTGRLPVSYGAIAGNIFIVDADKDLDNSDIDGKINLNLAKMFTLGPLRAGGNETPVNREIALIISTAEITPENVAQMAAGTKSIWMVAIAAFGDENTPDDEYWVSETCYKLDATLSGGIPCLGHDKVY